MPKSSEERDREEREKGKEKPPDTEVTMRESELRSLKRQAKFGPFGFILGAIAVILVAVGIYRTEWVILPQMAKVASGETGQVAKDVEAVKATVQRDSLTNAAQSQKIDAVDHKAAAATVSANQAVVIAKKVAADFEPVPEQLTMVNGELLSLREADAKLAAADSVITTSMVTLDTKVETYQSTTKEGLDTVLRQQSGMSSLLSANSDQLSRMQKHQTLTDIGNLLLHGVTYYSRYGPNKNPNGD